MQYQGDPQQERENFATIEQALRAVSEDLRNLREGLVAQLSEEISRLQTEVATLKKDYSKLQPPKLTTLSAQQIAQQQVWAKQLTQVLADHLQQIMTQRLEQVVKQYPWGQAQATTVPEAAQQMLASFDTSLSTTLKALQRELNSPESLLSQQLNHMHSLEQQGDLLLSVLIERLNEQLQAKLPKHSLPSTPRPVSGNDHPAAIRSGLPNPAIAVSPPSTDRAGMSSQNTLPLQFAGTPAPPPAQPSRNISQFQVGLTLVLLSTLALSFHNVVVRVVGSESRILNLLQLGGFIKLNLGNSLLMLWLRMLVVIPLMIPVAMFLYPPVWQDIKRFATADDRRPLINVFISGLSLFLSQVLIYIAIGEVGPGVAVTLLFMYPVVTVPLAWLLFRDRPTLLRWLVMATILLGVFCTALPRINLSQVASGGATGIFIALASGVAFAFYLLFMQLGFKKLHPVPVSLIQFSTIFVLSSSVIIFQPVPLEISVENRSGFLLGGLLLGVLTLIGYLANNFGVRLMGASLASIIASSGPAVTALLGLLIINDQLQWVQVLGILLVTFGVGLLSWERMKQQTNAPKMPKQL